MTIEEIRERKRELGYSIDELVRLSGVPRGTLQKVLSGATRSPRRQTLERLAAVLDRPDRSGYPACIAPGEDQAAVFHDAAASYGSGAVADSPLGNKEQGEYTLEDYLALPDDKRYELIDGVLYEMSSPTSNHQEIAGYLYYRLMSCAEDHHMPCRPYITPLDVQLDKDNRTIVQPDVIICCDPGMNIGPRLFGAPDFLAEVLSPSTKRRDLYLKLGKYRNAGVREYWILDPDKQTVIVYRFCDDDAIDFYSFDDDIPVAVSQGLCTVNFSNLKQWLI